MPSPDGEEAMLIDSPMQPSKRVPAAEDAYLLSLEATYPARPFRLFDLPRELRDNIYDYALIDHTTFKLGTKPIPLVDEAADRDLTPRPDNAMTGNTEAPSATWSSLQASVKFRASTNLLLASKTLKEEYEKRAKPATVIVLKDHDRYAFEPIMLPEQALGVHNLEMHLILFCHLCPSVPHVDERTCHASLELEQHRIWIDKLLPEMKALQTLVIHAYLCYDKYKPESKQKLPCEFIVEPRFAEFQLLPKVKSLTMCKYDFSARPDLKGPKVIITEWPPASKTEKTNLQIGGPEESEPIKDFTKVVREAIRPVAS